MKNSKKNLESDALYVGIDVGAKGGIAVIDKTGELSLYTIPSIKGKPQVDYTALANVVSEISWNDKSKLYPTDVYCCIEDVHSIYGMSAKSNFNFGYIKGFKVSLAIQNNFHLELVQPKVWQKEIWTDDDIIKKKNGRNDTKATSLLSAMRIFPDETFLATDRSSVPHDGLVDAALIAEYCKRKYGTQSTTEQV